MSIRFIGHEIYVPASPNNFAKGRTKVTRISTLPDEHEHKKNVTKWYREQLDQQVEEGRKRKLEAKKRQREEDQRRQKQFYSSLDNVQVHSPIMNQSRNKKYVNPQQNDQNDDNYHYQSSRLAHIGRRKMQGQISIFQNRGDLIQDNPLPPENIQYNEENLHKRRKDFNEEIDRRLRQAFVAIERSKSTMDLDEEVYQIKRKMKTQLSEIFEGQDYDSNHHQNKFYSLPRGMTRRSYDHHGYHQIF